MVPTGSIETLTDLAAAQVPSGVEDSLKKRYVYKFASNLFGFGTAMVTQTLVPRALGPANYGNYMFLTNFFSGVVNTIDFSSSVGFYSKLSQRLDEPGLIRFYASVALAVGGLVMLGVGAVFLLGFSEALWPQQRSTFVWLAAGLALLMWYSQVVNYVIDAYALTASGEIARMYQRIAGVGLILVLAGLSRLNLTAYFLYNYVTIVFVCALWWRTIRHRRVRPTSAAALDRAAAKRYSREFYEYSAPLAAHSLVGWVVAVVDLWLLQQWSGSVQQGFFALGTQVGIVCFLFTSTLTPLFVREFAKAFGDHDLAQMQALFRRSIPLFSTIAAFFGIFVAFQAGKISLIFGDQFQAAAVPIAVMSLYPIHQTYGQLVASAFHATGQTRILRNVGIAGNLIGLPVTLLLIAPVSLSGMNMGATGLALKMVFTQVITVNLFLWYMSRILRLSFWFFVWHQLHAIAVLAVLAGIATIAVNSLVTTPLTAFAASGVMYTAGSIGIALWMPSVFAVPRDELSHHWTHLTRTVRSALSARQ